MDWVGEDDLTTPLAPRATFQERLKVDDGALAEVLREEGGDEAEALKEAATRGWESQVKPGILQNSETGILESKAFPDMKFSSRLWSKDMGYMDLVQVY